MTGNFTERNFVPIVFTFAFVSLILCNLYSFFMFPPNYGWWQVYAYLTNSGLPLYRDINITFPPLFVSYYSFLIQFSNFFAVSTIFGIFQYLLVFYILYKALRLKFSFFASVISALTGCYLPINNVAYIVDDYHNFGKIFIAASLYLFIFSTTRARNYLQQFTLMFFLALATWAVFFTKQNIGLLLILFCLIGYAVFDFLKPADDKKKYFILFLFNVIVGFALVFSVLPMQIDDILDITIRNDAKGNVGTILSNFFLNNGTVKVILKSLLYFVFFLAFWYFHRFGISYRGMRFGKESQYYYKVLFALFICSMVVFFKNPEANAVVMALIYMWYLFLNLSRRKSECVYVFPFAGLVLAGTMTAGLGAIDLFFLFSFALAELFTLFEEQDRIKMKYIRAIGFIAAFVFCVMTFTNKFAVPYSWWGLGQGTVSAARFELPYERMRFYRTDAATSEIYKTIKSSIETYSKTNNDVYLFPHIPIFYDLHNKIPPTANIGQWFDIITNKNVLKDLEFLKRNSPNLVIMLDPAWEAYVGHSIMKKSYLNQLDIVEYFNNQVALGNYKIIKYQIYDQKIFGDGLGGKQKLDVSLKVNNLDVVGYTIDELYAAKKLSNRFLIRSVISNSQDIYKVIKREHKLKINDVLNLTIRYNQLDSLVQIFGPPDKTEENYYTLKIFLKNPNKLKGGLGN